MYKQIIKNAAEQGELAFRRIEEIPAHAVKLDMVKRHGGGLVVGHSESGHHHVVRVVDGQWEMFSDPSDPMICYLRLDTVADVDHLKVGPDAHASFCLAPGIWRINRQEELAPEGWRAVQD